MINKVVNFNYLLRHNKLPHTSDVPHYVVDFAVWARLSKNLVCYPPGLPAEDGRTAPSHGCRVTLSTWLVAQLESQLGASVLLHVSHVAP